MLQLQDNQAYTESQQVPQNSDDEPVYEILSDLSGKYAHASALFEGRQGGGGGPTNKSTSDVRNQTIIVAAKQ